MRNTVVVDMVNGGVVTAVDAVADDENTINLLVYTGSGANPQIHITTRDIDETITGFEPESIYFYEIPSEYYPEYVFDADNNMYVTLSDANQERTIRFHWSGVENGHMKLMYDIPYRYFVVFQKIPTQAEIVEAVSEVQEEINKLPETITNTASSSTVANNVNSFNLDGIFESIMTNIKPILLKYTAVDTYEYVNTPPSNGIRNYINIKENYIQFIEAHLPSGNTFAEAATTLFTLGGQQVYYTSITGSGAYKYLTFTSPTILSGSGVDVEQYKVRIPTPTATYIKSQYQWSYDSSISSYLVELMFGTGDANGRGIYKFVKDANSSMLVYTSRTTGAVLGIKITDEGVYYTQDGTTWQLIGEGGGADSPIGKVKIVDGEMTAAEIEADYNVYLAYDTSSTPYISDSGNDIIRIVDDSANGYGVFVKRETPTPPVPIPTNPALACLNGTTTPNGMDTYPNSEMQFAVGEADGNYYGYVTDPSTITDVSLWDWHINNPDNIPNVSIDQSGKLTVGNLSPIYVDGYVEVYATLKTDPTITTYEYFRVSFYTLDHTITSIGCSIYPTPPAQVVGDVSYSLTVTDTTDPYKPYPTPVTWEAYLKDTNNNIVAVPSGAVYFTPYYSNFIVVDYSKFDSSYNGYTIWFRGTSTFEPSVNCTGSIGALSIN